MLTVGALLQYGKYQIKDVLAVKGSSITYRATQCDLDRPVIIKTVVPEYVVADIGIGRFLSEARRLAELQHPHIVRVGDCFLEQGRLFLVTDFLSGQNLAQKIAQGPVAIAEALRYIRQIAQAIALMHRNGLLHRDIKPSNIMVSEDQHSATLSDFNIARALLTTPLGQPATQAANSVAKAQANPNLLGSLRGTEFIAPEPALSPHLWTVAADIYGLAATLYALVTGKAPVASNQAVKNQDDASKEQQILNLMPKLAQAISKGMAPEMSDRPSSVSEWLALLPENDSSVCSNGQANLGQTILEPSSLVVEDLAQADSTQADSTLAPAPIVANAPEDPTLAVLEHPQSVPPQPVHPQSVSNQKTQQVKSSSPKRSGSRTQRASSAVASRRPTRFPRKALLLSAIASGVGGIAFGFFMKTQIFSALVLPSSLPSLTPSEPIQETFPPKAGSQVSGTQSDLPLIEPPPDQLSPAEPIPVVPDATADAPTEAAVTEPTTAPSVSPLPASPYNLPDYVSKPPAKGTSKGTSDIPNYSSDQNLPISSPASPTSPSLDANSPSNLDPLLPSGGAEAFPGEQSSAPLPSATEPTLP
jgi:serine/threonine protein kinase